MIKNKKLIIVMPAYNVESTLFKTIDQIPKEYVDNIILIDDGSKDNTNIIAQKLDVLLFTHEHNKGYGEVLKKGFLEALKLGADIIIVLHSDNQYEPALVNEMALLIAKNDCDVVLASRMLDKNVMRIMPYYRYIANRILTFLQNIIFRQKLAEYHTGYRAYDARILNDIPYTKNSYNFVFDNELLAQIFHRGLKVIEIPCSTKYDVENSSISIKGSLKYFFGVMNVSARFLLHKLKLKKYRVLSA